MGLIFTISGNSGTGKSAVATHLLARIPQLQWIVSVTTRAPRPTDRAGEIISVTPEVFAQESSQHAFIWEVCPHGTDVYGTRRQDIFRIVHDQTAAGIMIILNDAVERLRSSIGRNQLRSFYFFPPGEEEIRRRLRKRGDSEETIARRLKSEADWDEEVRKEKNYLFNFFINDQKTSQKKCSIVETIVRECLFTKKRK